VVATAFLLWSGLAFRSLVEAHVGAGRAALDAGGVPAQSFGEAVTLPVALSLALGLVFFAPLLSMGVFAAERRAGTEELLFSLPLSESEIVLGKLAGTLGPVLGLLAVTLLYPVSLARDASVDWGQVAAAWLGLALAATVCLSFSFWVSARTASGVVAGVVALVVLLVWFFADRLLPDGPGPLGAAADALALRAALERFARGIVSARDVLFHVAVAGGFLSLTTSDLARRRRGR